MVHPLTAKKVNAQERFLRAYERVGTMTHAARAAGISVRASRTWAQYDDAFRSRLDDAKDVHTDSLESTMYQRLASPEKGTGSDILLMFALKARRPDTYRELPPPPPDAARSLLDTLKVALQSGATVDVKALQVTVSQDDTVPDTKQPELPPALDAGP